MLIQYYERRCDNIESESYSKALTDGCTKDQKNESERFMA